MRGALLATGVVVLLLTGCGDGGGGQRDGADRAPQGQYEGRPGTGGEVRTDEDARSTFAVDIDTASYGYARRLIREGRLPEPGNVRPEEFINAFEQDYPDPSGDGFAVHVDGSRPPVTHRDGAEVRLLRIGLRTRAEDRAERRDAALTFVVDVSSSMAEPGRLDLVRDALHTLVTQLRPTDSVAIVAFSSSARVVREMTRVSKRADLHAAIDALHVEESTNLEAGLVLGYRVARDGFREGATNRVIILSDGLANQGSTEWSAIVAQTREEARKEIALLGVGVGSQYGDELMERLADNGDGFVVYVSDRTQARDVFVRRLPATLSVRALDAKVQVTFDPRTVAAYRLIGYENRAVADEDFRSRAVDGGEVGPGHTVTALYVIRPTGRGERLGEVAVRWLDPLSREAREAVSVIELAGLQSPFASAGARLHVCYAAGYLAEVLRRGSAAGDVRLPELARIASSAAERTEDPAVGELADLIRQADALR